MRNITSCAEQFELKRKDFENAGVMPNPTVEKLYEGCKIAKNNAI